MPDRFEDRSHIIVTNKDNRQTTLLPYDPHYNINGNWKATTSGMTGVSLNSKAHLNKTEICGVWNLNHDFQATQCYGDDLTLNIEWNASVDLINCTFRTLTINTHHTTHPSKVKISKNSRIQRLFIRQLRIPLTVEDSVVLHAKAENPTTPTTPKQLIDFVRSKSVSFEGFKNYNLRFNGLKIKKVLYVNNLGEKTTILIGTRNQLRFLCDDLPSTGLLTSPIPPVWHTLLSAMLPLRQQTPRQSP